MSSSYTCGVYGSCADEFITKVCGEINNRTVVETTAGRVEFALFKVEDIDSLNKEDLDFIIQITNYKEYKSNDSVLDKLRSFCNRSSTYGCLYILGAEKYHSKSGFNVGRIQHFYTGLLDNGVDAFDFFLGKATNNSIRIIPHQDYIAVCGNSETALRLANHDATVHSDDPEVLKNYNITKIIVAPADDSYFDKINLLQEIYPDVPMIIVTNNVPHPAVMIPHGATVMRIPKNLTILTKQKVGFNIDPSQLDTFGFGFIIGAITLGSLAVYCSYIF